ncbi:DUF4054 domain-containing protein [Klebsiella quasipneumoniae]|uniref:DUF4054 domain-containing protein n=1 Tax=Klebsiella quasipneumoniae TaxID=1463165 RepID=UPI002DB8D953|nr:DUF4054 domain-containing protein [Klebsiella quasipneumoniae]MEB5816718.1 DUF4054 domain-containing protein [Klebsiella quasipneumoniae]
MAIVTFDSGEFLSIYPRFSSVLTPAQLQNAFDVACLVLDNTESSAVPYDPTNGINDRKTLLYALTCHIASMALWGNGQAGPASGATEGSVSVSFAVPDVTNASWFKMTPCGQLFWQATRKYVVGGRYYARRYSHPWG